MSNERPLVGVAMRIDYSTDRFYLARHYSEAIEAMGAVPVHVPLIPENAFFDSLVPQLDGILLPGSDSDMEPSLYGQEPLPGLGDVHPIKDFSDLALLKRAEERNLPVLAICFGMQSLNVSRGGTLIQDLKSQVPHAIRHQQGTPRDRKSHFVSVKDDSIIGELALGERQMVNSHHHQAVDKVGEGLVATSWTSDGIVEAVEDRRDGRWVLGVQWHPELGWREDPFSRRIFEAFVVKCREENLG